MSRYLKDNEFKEKSLKLLADPCKLKDSRYNPKNNDTFKNELEYKFNCELSPDWFDQVPVEHPEININNSKYLNFFIYILHN